MAWKAKITKTSQVTSGGTFEVSVDIIDTSDNSVYPQFNVSGTTKLEIKAKLQQIVDTIRDAKKEQEKFVPGEEINL